jgi:lipoate-protein ligase A
VTLQQVLGQRVTFEEAAEALSQGFARSLNLSLDLGELSADERAALELLREKHTRQEWLFGK